MRYVAQARFINRSKNKAYAIKVWCETKNLSNIVSYFYISYVDFNSDLQPVIGLCCMCCYMCCCMCCLCVVVCVVACVIECVVVCVVVCVIVCVTILTSF